MSVRTTIAWTVLVATLVTSGGVYVYLHETRRPPIERLSTAYDAISRAKMSGARAGAKDRLMAAESTLRLAEQTLARENAELLPFWSYRLVDSLLQESITLANKAAETSRTKRGNERKEVVAMAEKLRDSLSHWIRIMENDPGRADCAGLITSAQSLMNIADTLIDHGSPTMAREYLDSVRTKFRRLENRQRNYEEAIQIHAPMAKEWIEKTIRYTVETGQPALVVDKSAHRLMIVSKGRIKESFPCELGFNAAYQKYRSGDGATPEGMYKVTKVRHQSKYYKALMLNYPNEFDKERFKKSLADGRIPSNSKIGGLIEIHGEGGQERDWTDGCVAVTNDLMDQLMALSHVGMPVTIVHRWEGKR